MPANLDKITDFPALVDYLRDELEWPIAADIGLDEATYDVTPEEIGLKSSVVGGGIEIKQLRPLNRAQPWGVFFLNLPSAKLPVTLVRNILGKLAIKKRASANKSEQAAFAKHDLLFIAATGSAPDRRLAFAHFADDDVKGDAATLKVLGWDADDTPRRLGLTEASLKTKLHWPDDPADADRWRKQWGEAFAHADTRTVVRDSKAMAKALAALARRIRARATELIQAQTATGSLVKLHKAFKEALIHDLTPEGFADTYAQTIAYGLLSTAISRASGALTQDDMAANVAGTSPFLKEMLGTFIEAGGRKSGKAQGLDFDELGITDVVELLRNADMEAVLADFDRKNPDEDPVIHFYELFLKEYDAAQKVKRGVFYTPRPVVGFIVRSVDEVLRTEFGLEDGLASIATWGEVIAASKGKDGAEIALPEGAEVGDPFVRILDPATGTGTFLVECVDLIHKTMVAKWKAAGERDAEIKALWNAYVPAYLLPRLTGFELMMAPYAIAHVKLGLKLADTGYTFGSDARAQIYLTNALEPAQDMDMQLAFMSEALAHEAKAANGAKERRFTVVLGNPPYSAISSNLTPANRRIVDRYRAVNGVAIIERSMLQFEKNIQDDYLKFIATATTFLERSASGMLCFVTNHSYIDGRTLRGVRNNLINSFDQLRIVDLHGNALKKEGARGIEQNVFEIQQGVAVILGVIDTRFSAKHVYITDVFGSRTEKYYWLNKSRAANDGTLIHPQSEFFYFSSIYSHQDVDWSSTLPLLEVLPHYLSGTTTGFDELLVDFDRSQLIKKIERFVDPSLTDHQVAAVWDIEKGHASNILKTRKTWGRSNWRDKIKVFQQYPFDRRFALLKKELLQGHRFEVMEHLSREKPGLVATLQSKEHFGVFVSDVFCGHKLLGSYDRNSVFPTQDTAHGRPWINTDAFVSAASFETVVSERNLLDYIYAVLHSPAYRARYADYLKSDFARIPLPGSRTLFEALVPLGTELVALHLLDAGALPILKDPKGIRLAGSGEARVAHKPEYDAKLGRVTINATRWFENVPQIAWDFHVGGYQPAQKWLKDRAAKGGKKASDGRVLTEDDILHYRRMITALTRTAELMPQIDAVVEEHGGWPGAFRGMSDAAPKKAAE